MKKLKMALSLMLALAMCLGLFPAAFAADSDFVIENGVLTEYNGKASSVVIPNSVTQIGMRVFSDRSEITSVTIPSSVTVIGGYAFDGCTKLASVTFPSSVTSVGEHAFRRTPWLEGLGENAVAGNIYLKYNGYQGNPAVPDGVTTIAGGAFWGGAPVSVTIPASVTTIEPSAFAFCHKMKDVYFGGSEAQWKTMWEALLAAEIKLEGFTSSDSISSATIHYADNTPAQPEQPATPTGQTAIPTNDQFYVDGEQAVPAAYKIGGSNYFKIRDVAALLNGTKAQFSVGYDNATKSVTLTTGEGYERQDSDLAGVPAGSKEAVSSNNAIYINGEKAEVTVYKIGGSNYFKLRDLGEALGFNVGYTSGYGAFIETDKPYQG